MEFNIIRDGMNKVLWYQSKITFTSEENEEYSCYIVLKENNVYNVYRINKYSNDISFITGKEDIKKMYTRIYKNIETLKYSKELVNKDYEDRKELNK